MEDAITGTVSLQTTLEPEDLAESCAMHGRDNLACCPVYPTWVCPFPMRCKEVKAEHWAKLFHMKEA